MLLHWLNDWIGDLFKRRLRYLWKDELQVHIRPDHIELLRIRHGLRGEQTFVRRQVIEFTSTLKTHDPLSLNNDMPDVWAALGQSLGKSLQLPIWHKTKPVFIVANHWVRYALLPWNAQINSAAEQRSYVAHCFKKAFGEQMRGWHLAASTPQFEKTAIASALPGALLQTLEALASQYKSLKVDAVYPALTVAINQIAVQQVLSPLQASTAQTGFWFVMVEKSRVCVCLVENGDWQSIKNLAREADVSAQVSAAIQREIVLRETVHRDELETGKYPIALHCQAAADAKSFAVAGHKIIVIKSAWPVDRDHQAEKWVAA